MIITTIEELRLSAPAHAIDSIDGLTGFIDNSEHDFLAEKLGRQLYESLCAWYQENKGHISLTEDIDTGYYNRLLLLCQRCVAFDALGAASGMQVVSVNNAGINQMAAEDYPAAPKESVDTYRQTCSKEAHKAVNRLLQTLEEWTKSVSSTNTDSDSSSSGEDEMSEIVRLWKESRYFYLVATLLIPSATVLQVYFDFYENRERFIQMLPDLRYIQEEELEVRFGESIVAFFVKSQLEQTDNKCILRAIHLLRKAEAAGLESRTNVLRTSDARKKQAHDEMERHLATATDYLIANAKDIWGEHLPVSPIFPDTENNQEPYEPQFKNNQKGNAIFVVPALD